MTKKQRLKASVENEYREVYFAEAEGLGLVKIGWARNAKKRVSDLQIGCPVRLILRGVHVTDDGPAWERRIHNRFAATRARGEWFTITDDLRSFMGEHLFTVEEAADRMVVFGTKPRPHVEPVVRLSPELGESNGALARRVAESARAARVPHWH